MSMTAVQQWALELANQIKSIQTSWADDEIKVRQDMIEQELERALRETSEKQLILTGPDGETDMEDAPDATLGGFEVTGPEGDLLTELTNLPVENDRLSLALDSLLDPS